MKKTEVNRIFEKLGITDKVSLMLFIRQFIRFGLVGISNTVVYLGVYYAMMYLGVYYIIASIVAFVVSVFNAYFWSSRYVFPGKRSGDAKPLVKVFAVYGFTFLLSTGLMYCTVEFFNISAWIAPLITMCVTIPANFLLNKYWAFR